MSANTTKSGRTAKAIVEEVFGKAVGRELWTNNYDKVLPLTLQDFDMAAVLPAIYYMFRFGHRRGKGKFLETFANRVGTSREMKKSATIARVSNVMANTDNFEGFTGAAEESVLSDMLLCFALENSRRALGRSEQIQRVAPAHYMASWVDLPESSANLRLVPEMIVAMLADQDGEFVLRTQAGQKTWFAVGQNFEENVLLRPFLEGMAPVQPSALLNNLSLDTFDESTHLALDQLLMVRLGQQTGQAPEKVRGGNGVERISNQRPIAETASIDFSEDIRKFVREYSEVIPRHAFIELLESCMAVGLTSILTSVVEILCDWEQTGEILHPQDQQPGQLFADCSNGINVQLRTLAEQSMDDFRRRMERFPIILMALRLLDSGARFNRRTQKRANEISKGPYATEWLDWLGDLLFERVSEGTALIDTLYEKGAQLAEQIELDFPEEAAILGNEEAEPNPVWRLAEAVTALQGRANVNVKIVKLFGSAYMLNAPNGIATGRTVIRRDSQGSGRKTREVRSIVLTDAVLDYLVHLHVLPSGSSGGVRRLSLKEFIHTLHERYGFCIDVAPPGMSISNELLLENRRVLERRLRDLGLLTGVNDAEAMKRLKPRFAPQNGAENDTA